MGAPQTVLVSVPALIAAIEKRRRELQAEYDAACAKYERLHASWMAKSADKLERAAADMRKGVLPGTRYTKRTVRLSDAPVEPVEPDFASLDRDLASLKLMVEESIRLRTDSNFFQYL